jgi:D-lyxose ketol-isomerase
MSISSSRNYILENTNDTSTKRHTYARKEKVGEKKKKRMLCLDHQHAKLNDSLLNKTGGQMIALIFQRSLKHISLSR